MIHAPISFSVLMYRMGFARLAEDTIRKVKGKGETDKLGAVEKVLSSSIGGALATWNQPIEVVRIEVIRILNSFATFIHVLSRCKVWLRVLEMSNDLLSSRS